MGGGGSKICTPLQCMLDNFEISYAREDYGVDLDPETLQTLCRLDWIQQSATWPENGSWDVAEVVKVHRSVLATPHWGQFPYIDIWLNICQSLPPWAAKCKAKQEKQVRMMAVEVDKGKENKEKMRKLKLKADRQCKKDHKEEDRENQKAERQDKEEQEQKNKEGKNKSYQMQVVEEELLPPPYSSIFPQVPPPVPPPPNVLHDLQPAQGQPPYPDPAPQQPLLMMPGPGRMPRRQGPAAGTRQYTRGRRGSWPGMEDYKAEEMNWGSEEEELEAPKDDPKKEPISQCPLRVQEEVVTVPGAGGQQAVQQTRTTIQYVPFSTVDLHNWRMQCPPFGENPGPLTDLLQSIMVTHRPTWADIQTLLNALFTSGDRGRVIAGMQAHVREQNNPQIECPLADPQWDTNDAAQRLLLGTYRETFLAGVRRAGRKTVNLGKVGAVIQGPTESPGDYLERLKAAYSTYSQIDPEHEDNRRLVNHAFVSQSAKDIRRKLQKLPGFLEMPTAQLLEVAQGVYGARDTEEEKQQKQTIMMAALIRGEDPTVRGRGRSQGRGRGGRGGRGQGRGQGRGRGGPGRGGYTSLDPNQCARCKKFGHWKAECEEADPEPIMFQTEDQ